jgi:hypothetical protein
MCMVRSFATTIERTDDPLRQSPVAGVLLVALSIALAAMPLAGR